MQNQWLVMRLGYGVICIHMIIGMTKYFYKVSVVLLFLGVVCSGFGVRGIMIFLDDINVYRGMSVRVYVLSILLPHISLLAGIAFLGFGFLMLIRGVLFNREHSSQ
ncbi:MAG: hypothetical protein KAH23_06510 [Kiritimatiellae bacterium]|nr:hypothetical protein [Kiritimatiellia bacterium]